MTLAKKVNNIPLSIKFDQFLASAIEHARNIKHEKILQDLKESLENEKIALDQQASSFIEALRNVDLVREFLQDPERILGSERTKHGEIAEQVEVHVRNAYSILKGDLPTATFEGVGRTAPEDYIINGIKHQSKFINGPNNNLAHVLNHLDKYPNFVAENAKYTMPRDTYDLVMKLRAGEQVEGLNERSIRAILEKANVLVEKTGRSFEAVVNPSISTYSEVQRGRITDTLDNHDQQIENMHDDQQKATTGEGKKERLEIKSKEGPSVGEGVKIVGGAAVFAASTSFAFNIYKKHRSGTKINDFTSDDWKELGLDSSKAGVKASVSAGTIYTMTNLTHMGAPMAAAMASSTIGMASLVKKYKTGKINMDELITDGQILCLNSGVAALGAAAGQMLIPVPILGPIIGVMAADAVWGIIKGNIDENEAVIKVKLDELKRDAIAKIDEAYKEIVDEIIATYQRFGEVTDMAFDVSANVAARFAGSIELAVAFGVDEDRILRNIEDVNAYFLD